MPMIQLTASYNPGDLDRSKPYTHLAVHSLRICGLKNFANVDVVYGYLDSGTFTPGKVRPMSFAIDDGEGKTDFTAVKTRKPIGEEGLIAGVEREACQWLIDQGHFSGTIV